ncbi:MAG: inositol monophosphatase [Candidatus Obscuribacterales bacterium]|nr:inositol monophosphatase [Candidatus Obscuribacterales bacterium]
MENIKKTAFKAASVAGELLKERLGNIKQVDYKSAFNIVTDVDKASEKLILEIIKEAFPDDSILAEESGMSKIESNRRWLIDPLDGTTNYTHAYPFFSISIGFELDGKVVFATVFNPISNELFWAEKGKGAWLHDTPIKVSTVDKLSASLLATGFPPDTDAYADNNINEFATLTSISHGVRRDGSAALDLSFVACGRLDGFWETKLSPWDIAAGGLLVTEAGGRITNLTGGPLELTSGYILATNNLLHDEVLGSLAKLRQATLVKEVSGD